MAEYEWAFAYSYSVFYLWTLAMQTAILIE